MAVYRPRDTRYTCIKPYKWTWCKLFYLSPNSRIEPAIFHISLGGGQIRSMPFSEQCVNCRAPSLIPSGWWLIVLLCSTDTNHFIILHISHGLTILTGTFGSKTRSFSVLCDSQDKQCWSGVSKYSITKKVFTEQKLAYVYSRRNLAVSSHGSHSHQSVTLQQNVWIKIIIRWWKLHVMSWGQNLRIMIFCLLIFVSFVCFSTFYLQIAYFIWSSLSNLV